MFSAASLPAPAGRVKPISVEPPRFYCPALAPGIVALAAAESRHALQSLRLRPGDALVLFDGRGGVAQATLLPDAAPPAKRKHAPAAIARVERVERAAPPARTLTLFVAGCKGARLDWLVEKCSELGVTRLVLAEFERSVVRVGAAHVEKLRRAALEACKQCGRAWLPEIEAGVSLPAAARGGLNSKTDQPSAAPRALLIAQPAADAPWLADWLHQNSPASPHLAAVVGPEGGLTPGEVEMLRAAGGQIVRLAETILRVETAAISFAANWAGREE